MDAPLPLWQEGVLDIHAISTGRGECFYYIFPDGTTMMVDAGDLYNYNLSEKEYPNAPTRPSASAIPWQTQAAYVKYFMPAGHNRMDYFLATHYHLDHLGYFSGGRSTHEQGGYRLAGVTALYERVKFNKLIDRSYPDYGSGEESDLLQSYSQFVAYNTANSGLQVERFAVGSNSQIVQLYNASAYPIFQIRNYAGSGLVWNGTSVVDKTSLSLNENGLSCAFLLSYGNFDFFASGDLNNQNICSTLSNAIGRHIEAMKAHHHMSNEPSYNIEAAAYTPDVVVTQSFYERTEQPQQSLIQSYSGTQDMFFTGIPASLVSAYPEIYGACKCTEGHVVIRVSPGGNEFYVYVLDDTDYSYKVKAIHGPYSCS